jgi:hypothetical protein
MGVIFLTMTIGGLIAAALLLAISHRTKRVSLRAFVMGGVTTWLAGYVILFFIASFFSRERTLALNEPKEFCGFYLDCHMHAAVTGVHTTKTLGDRTAKGQFYVVKVKVFSDAKRATLGLLTPEATVVDAEGKLYSRDESAEVAIGDQPAFDRKISATESFTKEIAFDLPIDVKNPRLDIREGYVIDHAIEAILIGDEDAFGHQRNYFKLEEQPQVASVK